MAPGPGEAVLILQKHMTLELSEIDRMNLNAYLRGSIAASQQQASWMFAPTHYVHGNGSLYLRATADRSFKSCPSSNPWGSGKNSQPSILPGRTGRSKR